MWNQQGFEPWGVKFLSQGKQWEPLMGFELMTDQLWARSANHAPQDDYEASNNSANMLGVAPVISALSQHIFTMQISLIWDQLLAFWPPCERRGTLFILVSMTFWQDNQMFSSTFWQTTKCFPQCFHLVCLPLKIWKYQWSKSMWFLSKLWQ